MRARRPALAFKPAADLVVQINHVKLELDLFGSTAQRVYMASTPDKPLTHLSVLRIAVPIMLSNVTEPLIGVVNTTVIGQMPQPHLIGGVAVGSLIFSFLFWGFGFLRLSTSGLSAQATGARNSPEIAALIWRSLIISIAIGLALLALSPVIKPLAVALMGGSADVQSAAATYFSYRIFAAPAALANFAMLGWFVGQGRIGMVMVTQLTLSAINMALSALFVLYFNLGIAGVGLAVLIAEYSAVAIGLLFVLARLKAIGGGFDSKSIFDVEKLKTLVVSNLDMMIRTLCLLFAFAWFTSRGARAGDTVIAANTVLLHLFDVAAFLIDGFAYAAEALVGQAIGAKNRTRYAKAILLSSIWTMAFGFAAAVIIWFTGPSLINLMTVNAEVRELALQFLPWAALAPFLGAACFLFDGIFVGAMATREMRNMMVLSLFIYLGASHFLEIAYGNHGLWAALCIFFIARSASFAARLPSIKRGLFPHTA